MILLVVWALVIIGLAHLLFASIPTNYPWAVVAISILVACLFTRLLALVIKLWEANGDQDKLPKKSRPN